jgi:para-nitrobenzyl esterase
MTEVRSLHDLNRRTVLKGATLLAGAGMVAGLFPRTAHAAGDPVAETRYGKIRGSSDNGVYVFKGVRYGDDTGGANRFMPPQPPKHWAGIQDAKQWGASAPQAAESQDPFYAWYTTIQPISEDCLFVNVFTPGLLDNKKRPVMVWFHGGSWGSCAGTAPGFDGTNLARNGDVVVITVNHRLNAFGYVQFDDKDERFADSGNAGTLDLLAALRWVRDNVANFGGDPHNVTIFGQSGGAAKVVALMGTPKAKGLFHKAIVESCSGGMRIDSREEAALQAKALAANLGMDSLGLTGAALQKVSMDDLVSAMKKIADPFRPVVDGRTFTQDPFYPAAPAISSHIPLMIGNANTETTYYLQVDPKNFSLGMSDIKRRMGRFLKVDDTRVDQLIDAYRTSYPTYSPSELLTTMTTDYLFKRNTLRVASLQSQHALAPVYAWVFARETPIQDGRIHSPHTSEVPFIFGTTDAAVAQVGTGDDLAPMTKRMMATWTAFARHGNPNNSMLPQWTPFKDSDRQTMVLKMDSQLLKDPGGQARASLEGLPYYEYSISRTAFVKD